MKGNYSSKFRKAALGLTAVATSLLIGMTAACSQTPGTNEEDDGKVTAKEDLQEIKNGNFEFFENNDGLYPISTPDSWSFSYSGSSSSAMSGIINTGKEGWDYLTDPTLPDTLKDNDALAADDENKKDYNGALNDDMLYKNTHDALDDTLADDDASEEDKKAYVANPNTHNLRWDATKGESGGYVYVDENGAEKEVYTKDGKVYTDSEYTDEVGTNVLMVHNYRKDYFRGNEGYFNSATTVSLEANTTCKISLWVKTAELFSDNSKGERAKVNFNKGAYIKVNTSVGGNNLDSFTVKNINTEVLNPDGNDNGWVQYTVYVQASTFATTTVSLLLGLGENGNNGINTVEGYAFFDDIQFEKYLNLDELKKDNADFDTVITDTDSGKELANTCHPLAKDARMTFRVDEPKYQTQDASGNNTNETESNNSKDRAFFIDFASSFASSTQKLTLNATNVSAGLTVDGEKYVSSKNTGVKTHDIGALDNGASTAKLPTKLKNNGLTISDDLLTTANIGDGWVLNVDGFEYNTLLTDSLKTAAKLPGVNGTASTLVMLSARGAAYEAKIADPAFTVADGEYKLLSFWLKTSDFSGKTAATITVYDVNDEDNTSNFTLDASTQATTDFGDEKDIYSGWVRCFIRVGNTSGESEAKNFGIRVNLGRTDIKGTTAIDYKSGWIAVTDLSVMELDEDVYGYTSSLSNTAALSFTETNETNSKEFDSVQGGTNQIKTDLATPSSYTGANGASVAVKPTGAAATDYDTTNNNNYAGLINRENLDNYKDKDWYSKVYSKLPNAPVDNQAIWEALAGKYSYQPLLIVNTIRNAGNGTDGVYNYGYIGNKQSFSADSYTQVSVRVKVSQGAKAYVYLVDTDSENNDVLTYKTPAVNFYYDDNGNILKEAADSKDTKEEAKAKIAYTLRDDGLYENGDGKLYANFYNLTKYYDYKYEHESFFNEAGEAVTFENLITGNTYYADASKTKYAPHYLIAGGKENNKVYEYVSGLGDNATYCYVENGKVNTDKVVNGVNKNISVKKYNYDEANATPYSFVIDGNNSKYANKWVTVTFNVHTGNEAKNYRLELWAGERDKQQSEGITEDSYVLFDYSPEKETALDNSTFTSKLSYYTDAIRADLIENIQGELPDNEQSIAQLEELVGSDYTKLYDYEATHYTFSLYDSPAFIPFNAGTAEEGQKGYSYLYSDYEEALGLLKVIDTDDENDCSMTAFIDYSVTDKKFDIIGEPTVDTDPEPQTPTTTDNSANVWLLAASIAVVAAILVAIIAIAIKHFISKSGKNKKHVSKNTYNFNKNRRYVKKYVKANGETPEANEEVENGESNEQPVEEQPSATEETQVADDTAEKPEGDGDNKTE